MNNLSAKDFLEIADHTLLASGATAAEVDAFLTEAADMGVKRVCISPSVLPVNKRGLEIVTVVGFPSGAHKPEVKAFETAQAVADGADEIDMVVNAGLVHTGDWHGLEKEVRAVRDACVGKVLKVIIESAALSETEIVGASLAAERGGADFVKTSTGFHPAGGASESAVKLMADAVGPRLGVKASGGVRSAADVAKMSEAGATRFGVSGTAAIVAELEGN